MVMAAKKLQPQTAPGAEDKLIPFNMRMPESVLLALDEWVEELNRARTWPKVTRSDIIRTVLDRACRERPDLDGK
jgi:hypothetical protein